MPGSCCCSLTCAQLLARLSLSAWPPPQIVLNRGSSGCAQLPPGPPINLRATPGDGEVTLTWDRPRNGACVTTYEVMAVPLGRSGRSLGMAPIRRCADRLLLQQAAGLTALQQGQLHGRTLLLPCQQFCTRPRQGPPLPLLSPCCFILPYHNCSPDYKLSISSLENGQPYRFIVRVSSTAALAQCRQEVAQQQEEGHA